MRAYTLGNGSLHVGVDMRGQVRDLYYPHVGRENHVGGRTHRIGTFVDGALSWTEGDAWSIAPRAHHDTMVGSFEAINERQRIVLSSSDVVYNEKNLFLREVTVKNNHLAPRRISLFFSHEYQIGETERGDTGYFDPRCHALVHYEGRRMLLSRAQSKEGVVFDQWSVGLYGIEGKEGTYRDAEDGELSMNGIEHGQVDSVMRLSADYAAGETRTFYYWVAVGQYFKDIYALNQYVLEKTPAYLMGTASDYWRARLKSQGIAFSDLPESVVQMFTRSLLVVYSHLDQTGSIIASSDTGKLNQGRDTYAYMWPRDGAYAARSLILAGDTESARKFFEFCNTILAEDGYMMHKYLPDGSVGSSWHPWVVQGEERLPIQADETAIILVVLKEYYQVSRDIAFIEEVFNSLIKRSADFLARHVDMRTNLPKPSYDLWEEVFSVSPYTAAATYGALRAAQFFADLLGKHDVAQGYAQTAEKIQEAIMTHLYNAKRGAFYKHGFLGKDGVLTYDVTLDFSSTYGIYEFGVLPQSDPRLEKSMKTMEKELELGKGTIGGMPRNETDQYYRTDAQTPPNPWTVTTLWKAQYYLRKAQSEEDLKKVEETLQWVVARATVSGTLSEQVHPKTGEIIGATPLVWSHSEFVTTVIEYLQKLDDLGLCKVCYPIRRR